MIDPETAAEAFGVAQRDQLETGLRVWATVAGACRDQLIGAGFTREESARFAAQWISLLIAHNLRGH